MKTTNHSLQISWKANTKEPQHLPLVDRGLILYEICILPVTRMGNAKTNLSKTPHGSERTRNQISIKNVLRKCDIPCITVNHGGANGLVDLAASLGLVVLYEKNNAINSICNLSSGENSLLDFALSNTRKLVHDADRNGNRTQTSSSPQIQWGISQNQGFSAACNRQFDYIHRSVIIWGKGQTKILKISPP